MRRGPFGNEVARLTGLEPATPGVTGRYSNQLSYNRAAFMRRLIEKPESGVKRVRDDFLTIGRGDEFVLITRRQTKAAMRPVTGTPRLFRRVQPRAG